MKLCRQIFLEKSQKMSYNLDDHCWGCHIEFADYGLNKFKCSYCGGYYCKDCYNWSFRHSCLNDHEIGEIKEESSDDCIIC